MIARYGHAHFTTARSSLLINMHSRRLLQIPCTTGSDLDRLVVRDKGVIHLPHDCLPPTWLNNAARNLARPTCPAKNRAPPIPTLFPTAPPIFAGFHDCGCPILEGADLLAKGTILSEVESAHGACLYQVQPIHTISVIVGGHSWSVDRYV